MDHGYLLAFLAGAFLIGVLLRKTKIVPEVPIEEEYDWDIPEEGPVVDQCFNESLRSVILYIISKSDPKKFSRGKLQNYLLLLNQKNFIDITPVQGTRGPYVAELSPCLDALSKEKIIFGSKVETRSGGYLYSYKLQNRVASNLLTGDLKNEVDSLIAQWDKRRSTSMLESS